MWAYVFAGSVGACIIALFVLLWLDYRTYEKERGENRRIAARMADVKRRRPPLS